MSLETLLSTPHTHGLITLCTMADPDRSGFLAINQGYKGTCDIDPAIAPKFDQLYVGFKVTGMEDYELPVEELREGMTKMVKYHALCVLGVSKSQLLAEREVAAVVWNDRPHNERSELGFDLPHPEYVALVPKKLYARAMEKGLEVLMPDAMQTWVVLGNFEYPAHASDACYEVFGCLLHVDQVSRVIFPS